MPNEPKVRSVYKSLNKPLTICGVERRLFFTALVMGAATFNLFGSLLSGVLMFVTLYVFARWATANDPEILRILLNSSRFKVRYDPTKLDVELFCVFRRSPPLIPIESIH